MEEALRAGLIVFFALSALGASPALFRRLEPLGLLFLHSVGLCTAFGAALADVLGRGDGRPFLLCYGAIVLAAGQPQRPPVDGRRRRVVPAVPLGLVIAGLVLQAIAIADLIPVEVVAWAVGAIALTTGVAAAASLLRRARRQEVERARTADRALAGAALLIAFAGLLAALPVGLVPGLWPVALGAAGALVTAVRTPPFAPPPLREWLAASLTGLVVVFAATALGMQADAGRAALGLGLLVIAVLALCRPLLESTRLQARAAPAQSTGPRLVAEPPLSAPAISFMAPMVDDAFLRRPGRPRVIARVPARRLLDAALERARQAHLGVRGKKDDLRVEVIAGDAEVDVDGDPVELSEALCAVLDNALRLKAKNPEMKVQIYLRGGPGHVTFEVSDHKETEARTPSLGPNPDAPFFGASTDADRPGLGVGLARARLLVEKNGGKLLTRTTTEGSCVQLTIPRRMQKQAVGQA